MEDGLGALNWATGETVAIKEIQLGNIPKSEIGQIMVRPLRLYVRYATERRRVPQSEIDLLKNLNVSIVCCYLTIPFPLPGRP